MNINKNYSSYSIWILIALVIGIGGTDFFIKSTVVVYETFIKKSEPQILLSNALQSTDKIDIKKKGGVYKYWFCRRYRSGR